MSDQIDFHRFQPEVDEPSFTLLARDAAGGQQAWLGWIIGRLEAIRDGRKPLADIAQVKDALDRLYRAVAWREAHSREGWPLSPVELPGPADRAWLNTVIDTLMRRNTGRRSNPDDAAADQGYGR